MGGSSSADTTSQTIIDTKNFADSFNSTVSKVLNIGEGTGAVNIMQASNTPVLLLLPVLLGGLVLLVLGLKKG